LINHYCWTETEMTPLKAAFLSIFMLSGIFLWGAAVYVGDAAAGRPPVDGYGVNASR
jgi:hypothetical protein